MDTLTTEITPCQANKGVVRPEVRYFGRLGGAATLGIDYAQDD